MSRPLPAILPSDGRSLCHRARTVPFVFGAIRSTFSETTALFRALFQVACAGGIHGQTTDPKLMLDATRPRGHECSSRFAERRRCTRYRFQSEPTRTTGSNHNHRCNNKQEPPRRANPRYRSPRPTRGPLMNPRGLYGLRTGLRPQPPALPLSRYDTRAQAKVASLPPFFSIGWHFFRRAARPSSHTARLFVAAPASPNLLLHA